MTAIIGCASVYRDEEFLRSSLDSYVNWVDSALIFDGRYSGFPRLAPDRTGEIVHEVAARFDPMIYRPDYIGNRNSQKLIFLDTEAMHHTVCLDHGSEIVTDDSHTGHNLKEVANVELSETDKRNLFFRSIEPGNWAFIIDGDEVCVGDVKLAFEEVKKSEQRVGWVFVEEQGNPGFKPRFLKVEKGMRYGQKHWEILDGAGKLITDSYWHAGDFALDSFKIYNFGYQRRSDRGKAHDEYRETMRKKNWKE